jgi:GTPase SAR1 family protein
MFGKNAVASFGLDDNALNCSLPLSPSAKASYDLLIVGSEGAGKTLMSRRLKGSNCFY